MNHREELQAGGLAGLLFLCTTQLIYLYLRSARAHLYFPPVALGAVAR